MSAPKLRVRAELKLDAGVIERAKLLLRGATNKVSQHRVSVGIHEEDGSARARSYRGKEAAIKIVEAAMLHEFGTDVLPERSWLRTWFDQNVERFKAEALGAMQAEYKGDKDAVRALAVKWYIELRAWIVEGTANLEDLQPRTKAAREAAGLAPEPPLYATKRLVQAINALVDGRPA